MKIMVADDDPIIRMIVSAGMKALGHQVFAYETGLEAWTAFQQSPSQIIITDWAMPAMDGIQLTEAVRTLPSDSYTYVIMLTGHGSREEFKTGIKAGVDAFLIKPLDGALLEAQVTIATRIVGLQEHARRLEAIITICSHCKRIHSKGEWMSMEEYVVREFKMLPPHTYCPTCLTEKVEPQTKALGP
jgi:Response regulators consisting of a CheY-like receiver domain and a winged-helix DNA-binding domain